MSQVVASVRASLSVVAVVAVVLVASPRVDAAAAGVPRPLEAGTRTFTVENAEPGLLRTAFVFESDHLYRLVASGTVSDWCPPTAKAASDCSYGSPLAIAKGVDSMYCYAAWRCRDPEPWGQLRINGMALDAFVGKQGKLSYQSSHRYAATAFGLSGRLTLVAADAVGSSSDNSGAFTLQVTDLGEIPAAQLRVPISSVSNGCGGQGWKAIEVAENYVGNTSWYVDSNVHPAADRYAVDFKAACDLHDACYGGAVVRDVVNGIEVVDFRNTKRTTCDTRFLEDMRALCRAQIPATARTALANCLSTGGRLSFGAKSRYNFVRCFGSSFYDVEVPTPGAKTEARVNDRVGRTSQACLAVVGGHN